MKKNFIAICNVCGQRYENWSGSTPCCGSIAYIEDEIYYRKPKIERIINRINNV